MRADLRPAAPTKPIDRPVSRMVTISNRQPSTAAPRPAPRVQREGRLPLQDEWVFESTVSELAKVTPSPRSMVDLGAGPSRALEIFMASTGCSYSAVDSHGQMVATRIRGGANPQRNHVAQLHDLSLFQDFQFDLAFSRAALGWIPDAERRAMALNEQLRIGWRTLILNFDWSAAAGGTAFNEMRDAMAEVLKPMGFDPYYGAIQHAEVASFARKGARVETTVIKSFSRRFRGVVLASAKGVLASPTSKHQNRCDQLVKAAQLEMSTGSRFSLPSIVATRCS